MTKFLLNQATFAALAIFLKYASAECDDIAPPCPTDGLLLLQHLSCVEIGNVTLATAAYRCNTFCHKFVGKSLYHYSDGEWTDLEECPRCERFNFTCGPPVKTIGANSTVRLLEDPPRCGTRAIHTCPPGFKEPEPDECVRDWRVPGISKGAWLSEASGSGLVCFPKRANCSLANMTIVCGVTEQPVGQVAMPGETITWRPYDGYTLLGASQSTCQPDGTWSHPPPCCHCGGTPDCFNVTVKQVSDGYKIQVNYTSKNDTFTIPVINTFYKDQRCFYCKAGVLQNTSLAYLQLKVYSFEWDPLCEEYFKGLPKRAQISSFTFHKFGRRKIYHLTFKKKDVTKTATCEVRTKRDGTKKYKMYPIPIC